MIIDEGFDKIDDETRANTGTGGELVIYANGVVVFKTWIGCEDGTNDLILLNYIGRFIMKEDKSGDEQDKLLGPLASRM